MTTEQAVDLVIIDSGPSVHRAEIVKSDGSIKWLKCAVRAKPGTPICLQNGNLSQWLYGRVEDDWVHGIQVRVRGMSTSERRDYARVYGGITLLYQVAAAEDQLAALRWMQTGETTNKQWHTPDPFMDFSGSGMRFHHSNTCKANDLLLLEFKTPGSENWNRAVGEVVRVVPIPEEERDLTPFEEGAPMPTHWIALHYRAVNDDTVRTLVSFTERIQEAAIELM
jgi:hypothetical protein